MFEDHGFYLVRGRRGQDVTIAQRFNSDYWNDMEKPGAFITKACPNGTQEVMGLKWEKHYSEAMEARKNAPEKIRDKDNHWWDATAVLFDEGVQPFIPEIIKPTAGTFQQAVDDLRLETYRNRTKRGGINVR